MKRSKEKSMEVVGQKRKAISKIKEERINKEKEGKKVWQ